MSRLGLLLPAYNEEKNIQAVIKEAKKFLPADEILVVDDGSLDRTSELASKMKVKVLRHEKNLGKGEALKTGFKYFLTKPIDFVIVIDTDMQYRPRDAWIILEALENKKGDFISGFRIPADMPYANRAGNFIWRTLFNLLFGAKLKDISCGLIGLDRMALKKIKNVGGGYIIESSMFVDCVKGKLKIHQVPVKVYYGKRKIGKFARMFFGVLFFILNEGIKYRLEK